METVPRILKPSDFGEFELELKRAFKDAFHFAWDAGDESPEERERRKRFSLVIKAARVEPDAEPAMGLELMRECYALHTKISAYLRPDDALRDDLARIAAALASVGEKIASLPCGANAKTEHGCPSVPGLRRGWTRVEHDLRLGLGEFAAGPAADEIARLRSVARRTSGQVSIVWAVAKELTLGGNVVTARERAEDLAAIAESLQEISLKLDAFCEKCTPPADDEGKFQAYFERLEESIPSQAAFEVIHGALTLCTEVPPGALVIQRELPARRGAILQWLCTRDPEFFPLLPSAARRDHGAPATTGGADRRNWVLRGITAALVLLELVDAGAPQSSGKDLFKSTMKRVDGWVRAQTATGGFYVDATTAPEAFTTTQGDARIRRVGLGAPLEARYQTRLGVLARQN